MVSETVGYTHSALDLCMPFSITTALLTAEGETEQNRARWSGCAYAVRLLEPIPTNSFMVFDVNDENARSLFQVHQQ